MDDCGSNEGWLITFDLDNKKSWAKKITWETKKISKSIIIGAIGY